MDESSPHTGRETPSDIDLYCLTCGYNLRGLSGDPRRCPECGNDNPIGDIMVPAELISQQLRNLETAPVICIGLLVLCSLILVGAVAAGSSAFVCASVAIAILAALWIGSALRFRNSCMAKELWGELFFKFQIIGFVASWCIVGPAIGFVAFHRELDRAARYLGPWTAGYALSKLIIMGTILGLGAAVLLRVALHHYPRLRSEMDDLQREVAVRIAHDTLRRRLSKSRR